jgi:hypothetical protein
MKRRIFHPRGESKQTYFLSREFRMDIDKIIPSSDHQKTGKNKLIKLEIQKS